MSGLFSRIKEKFCKKRVEENRDDDICMSDIVECLREMGYENLRLIIRIYIFDRRPELLKLYKATSDAVNDELMMVRSIVRVSGENTVLEIC